MALDKKVSELQGLPSKIAGADISLIVKDNVDYKFTFTELITFISENVPTGSVLSFSTDDPSNAFGKNGDVIINPNTLTFYYKKNGVWQVQFTIQQAAGAKVLFGNGKPSNQSGNNNDTYIDTLSGIFYNKSANVWSQFFSMQSGPAGAPGKSVLNGTNNPTGAIGTDGDFYINTVTWQIFGPKAAGSWPAGVNIVGRGNSVLNGTANPANNIGIDGDFYINKSTYFIFGPKAAGVWPAGVSLISRAGRPSIAFNYIFTDSRFSYDNVTTELTFTFDDATKDAYPYDSENDNLDAKLRIMTGLGTKSMNTYEADIRNDNVNYISVTFEGVQDPSNLQILLK